MWRSAGSISRPRRPLPVQRGTPIATLQGEHGAIGKLQVVMNVDSPTLQGSKGRTINYHTLNPGDQRMTNPSMTRRAMLRGLGVSMALPWLESLPVWGDEPRSPQRA